jgi:hypothetical protein
MKINQYILSAIVLGGALIFSGCDKDDDADKVEMTSQQKASKALSDGSPWTVKSVVSKPDEDIDETPLMSLELSFETTGTETTIAPGKFELSIEDDLITNDANATWAWSGAETSKITLTGSSISELKNIEFSPDAENPTSIKVTFELTTINGRAKGLGEYTIELE